MKKNLLYGLLFAEALLCVGLAVMPVVTPDNLAGAMAFPFAQIGLALRALSLSGAAGNAAALLLYTAICLSPCVALLLRKPRRCYPEDALVGLLSLSLFFVLYQMINPGAISIAGGFAAGIPVAKAVLGGTVYSVLTGYLILRLLRRFCAGEEETLQRYLCGLLFLLNMLFVAAVFGGGVSELLTASAALQVENSGNSRLLGVNRLFLLLRFAVDALPDLLNIGIVFGAISFLQKRQRERYSDETVAAAQRLSKICIVSLSIVVVCPIAFNLLQLLFAKSLFAVNNSLELPLFSIVFVLGCLLFTRLVAESKTLKDDNDSMI